MFISRQGAGDAPGATPNPRLLEGKWDLNTRAEPGGRGSRVRGHAGGRCAAQRLLRPPGTRGGQVGHGLQTGAGGPLSAASSPRLELLVCKNPLMRGTAHRGRGPAIGPRPSHPPWGAEPPQLPPWLHFSSECPFLPPDSSGMSLTLAASQGSTLRLPPPLARSALWGP